MNLLISLFSQTNVVIDHIHTPKVNNLCLIKKKKKRLICLAFYLMTL